MPKKPLKNDNVREARIPITNNIGSVCYTGIMPRISRENFLRWLYSILEPMIRSHAVSQLATQTALAVEFTEILGVTVVLFSGRHAFNEGLAVQCSRCKHSAMRENAGN